jgi:hypothetical protein
LRGEPPRLEPGVVNDLHFIICSYPTSWGTGPWISNTESIMGAQAYIVNAFDVLRGAV